MCFDLSLLFSGHRKLIESRVKPINFGHLSMGEINRKRLKELLKIPENNVCADCQDPGKLFEQFRSEGKKL